MKLKKFNAFTLAEVLITLGIIGVVAAMTMPTLINQTNGAQYRAAYKKALSAISQAVTLNVALEDVSFADAADNAALKKILKDRMNWVSETAPTGYSFTKTDKAEHSSSNTVLFFNDGSMFEFSNTAAECTYPSIQGATGADGTKRCQGFIDVNGAKGPNKVVACDNGTSGDTCKVSSPTDIYPVQFYDQTILPGTYAAKAVLYGK